jgi:ATP-dependent helicase/nuclease subunit A
MKGLENRVIILPDLARRAQTGRTNPMVAKTSRSPSGRPLPVIRVGDLHGTVWAWVRQEDALHELAEEVRVLYVALTRARDELILLAAPKSGTAAWLDALAPWGYLHDDPPADGELLCGGQVLHKTVAASPAPPREAAEPEVSDEQAVQAYAEAVRQLQLSAKPLFIQPSGDHEVEPYEGTETLESGDLAPKPPQRDVSRAAGILIHRLLEHWDGGSTDRLRESLRAATAEAATEAGVEVAELEREASEIIDAFLGSDLVDRFRSVELIDRELSLLLREGERAYRGSIDLLYRDESGALVVADFKTDRQGDAERLRTEYAEQLSIYARAVQQALDLAAPPRAELWHLRTGQRIEI